VQRRCSGSSTRSNVKLAKAKAGMDASRWIFPLQLPPYVDDEARIRDPRFLGPVSQGAVDDRRRNRRHQHVEA
jgi:hypothetical protein